MFKKWLINRAKSAMRKCAPEIVDALIKAAKKRAARTSTPADDMIVTVLKEKRGAIIALLQEVE